MKIKNLKAIRYKGKYFNKNSEINFEEDEEAKKYLKLGIFVKITNSKETEKIEAEKEITEIIDENPVTTSKKGKK
ncbi:hypothetical protein SAMN02745174_02280 [Cetobacterium ceti]|uniref:Uncharacterized protein n=1 Tax=Cetobacterium ceti TaxID=180163 RepID=A0A1T4QCR7_9FUSO|nr:hypothetical protein [Cetobacterium ceti]SKA01620.1 hypothetical protein SAMN02745174_02280 [Cetobacterium ceti]